MTGDASEVVPAAAVPAAATWAVPEALAWWVIRQLIWLTLVVVGPLMKTGREEENGFLPVLQVRKNIFVLS